MKLSWNNYFYLILLISACFSCEVMRLQQLACNQVILTPNKTVAEIHEATNNIVSHINMMM
jgi:hypothetical protein